MTPTTGVPVRVRGQFGGAPIDVDATLAFGAEGFTLALPAGEVTLPWDVLDGVRATDDAVELIGRDGTATRLEGLPAPARVAEGMRASAQVVPELTTGLRGFASVHGAPGSDHDVFFGPLLDARRAAAEAIDPEARLSAFDAAVLREAFVKARRTLATRRFADDARAGDRRALIVELEELMAPAEDALGEVAAAADAVRDAREEDVLRAWRRWLAALGATWEALDQAWLGALPVLADSRGVQGSFWRRLLRRGEG
jgi:hypothetical protein